MALRLSLRGMQKGLGEACLGQNHARFGSGEAHPAPGKARLSRHEGRL